MGDPNELKDAIDSAYLFYKYPLDIPHVPRAKWQRFRRNDKVLVNWCRALIAGGKEPEIRNILVEIRKPARE
jgi:hypothetical protein